MNAWRRVCEDAVEPAHGLAADEVQARRVGGGRSPPTLRLYTYQPCALVGRFQTLANELNVAACRSGNVAVNRRPTGGGAIVMGPDQLGVALTLKSGAGPGPQEARALMARFSEGLVRGLASLGIAAVFRGKNDLEAGGRKLAGLGIYRDRSGGMLFHASLLVDLDVAFMLAMLRTPFEKISDKAIATVAERVTTVRRECGRRTELDEVRLAVAEGFAASFAVTLQPGAYDAQERAETGRMVAEKYGREDWVLQEVAVPDRFGTARAKTPLGLLELRVTLAGRIIKAAYIGGDFFAPDVAVADLEARLRWHAADPAALADTLAQAYARWGADLEGLPRETLLSTILAAADQLGGGAAAYGCFVNPQGT